MALDLVTLSQALYDRAATDSAGLSLRALLGSASSLFKAEQLDAISDAGNPSRPALPWLVWRPLDVGGPSGQLRAVGGAWWAYAETDAPVLAIQAALDSLYGSTARFAIAGARLQVTFLGRPVPDATLGGLRGAETRLTLSRLG